MNFLFTVSAASIFLLRPTSGTSIQIKYDSDHPDLCNNSSLSLSLSTTTIGREYIASPSLRCLSMSQNGIQSIVEGAFDQLPNLEYLNLQNNLIPSGNLLAFGNLTNIKKLILSDNTDNVNYDNNNGYNRYKYYDQERIINVRGIYPQLQYLDLRNTGAKVLESGEENPFPELKYLDFSSNEITRTDFMNLNTAKKLTYLSLGKNEMNQVSLKKFPNLYWIDLDGNKIEIIGYDGLDLTGLSNLNYLSVVNNKINFIRRGAFRDTVKLQYLNISMNNLSSLYVEILTDLKFLQALILDHNSFDAVPIMIAPMNLTTLSMKYNNMKYLRINTLNLPYLKKLFLSGNSISDIHPGTFAKQQVLEELYLNDNQLTSLPKGWCDSMKMLQLLDLSGNQFTLLESLFYSSAPSLQFIYFERNPLEYIDTSTFHAIPKNVTVYLKTNFDHSTELEKNPRIDDSKTF